MKTLILSLIFCIAAQSAEPTPVRIVDVIRLANGERMTGTVSISSPGMTCGTTPVAPTKINLIVTNGAVDVSLYSSVDCQNNYYTVSYLLPGVPTQTRYWIVPASPATTTIAAVQQPATTAVMERGPAGTVAVGTVASGAPLSVTNVGSSTAAVLNFVIPGLGQTLLDPGSNGIIKRIRVNTTAIAEAADYPILNQNTSGSAATVTSISSHASTELSDTGGIVRGAAALTAATAIPVVSSTAGSLVSSSIYYDSALNALVFGGATTDGSFRMRVLSTGFLVERRESGAWVGKGSFK